MRQKRGVVQIKASLGQYCRVMGARLERRDGLGG